MRASTVTDGKENCRRQPKPTATDQTGTCSAWGMSSLCSLTGQAVPTTSGQREDRPFSTHSTPSTILTAPAETQAHQGSCTKAGQQKNRGYRLASHKCSAMKTGTFTATTKVCLKTKQRSEHHKVVHLFREVIYPPEVAENIQTLKPPEVFSSPLSSFCLWLRCLDICYTIHLLPWTQEFQS